MEFSKRLILTTAALSVAGAMGLAYSQTSTDTVPPPTTSTPSTDARAPDTTTPSAQESTTQPTSPQSSGSTMDSGSPAASSGDSATMGSEQVARADRN
jgi:hypothetical protein